MASPIRTGKAALPSAGGPSKFIKIGDGESVTIASFVDLAGMISIDQHALWQEGGKSPMFACLRGTDEKCPGCEMGDDPKYKGFLPVLDKENGPKIYSFGISVARQLADVETEVGSLKGRALRIKRAGSGLKTKYTVIPLGNMVSLEGKDVPDIEESIGPTTREGILTLLAEAGIDPTKKIAKKAEAKRDDTGTGGDWETIG